MPPHGNSHLNDRPHHLYQIDDEQEKEVLKFGISDNPIGEDGLLKRIRSQLSLLNLAAGWQRYSGKVLLIGIPGRHKAEQIEQEFIVAFEFEKGYCPRGNPPRNKKKH